MPATMTKQTEPPPATWSEPERDAWRVPAAMRPSEHAEKYRRVYRSAIPGPYRISNAPYQRGMMDIITRPGCVQAVCQKGARIGWSEVVRNLILYWAHHDPCPVGLTLPNREEGRKVSKGDVRPMFLRTPVLRKLVGNVSRDLLIETMDLMNGSHLGLMWSGSAAATAGKLYRVVIVDEADKAEDWGGDEPDLIGRLESRIATFGDRRLLLAGSTPTTVAGKIHQMLLQTSFILHYQVPCPHCGRHQRLIWPQFKWAKAANIERWQAAAREAAEGGRLFYEDEGYVERFADAGHLAARIEWLADVRERMAKARTKGEMADVLAYGREHLVWYQCIHCPGRIADQEKSAVIRKGRWTTDEGYVTDYWGKRHEDAETVERWPNETRIGLQIPTWYSLFMHWGTIVGEFLRADRNLEKSFNWRTERGGEPFEHQVRRLTKSIFAEKVERATLEGGICPPWAWMLLATIDTQMDYFYAVVRAWGAGERSQRVWHGKLMTFDEIDHLLLATSWPVAEDAFPPMRVASALIDSGGTVDRWTNTTRTQQVYQYVIPRQGIIRALKGANKPGPGLYWPMKNPMGSSTGGKKAPATDLRAWMVDTHKCNDLLADMIIQGVPRKDDRPVEPEKWLLNQCPDPSLQGSWDEYNSHMAAVHKAPDKPGRNMVEVWKAIHSGARIDYRDCEAYQIALAQMTQIHLLPAEAELMLLKQAELEMVTEQEQRRPRAGGGEDWTPTPL